MPEGNGRKNKTIINTIYMKSDFPIIKKIPECTLTLEGKQEKQARESIPCKARKTKKLQLNFWDITQVI